MLEDLKPQKRITPCGIRRLKEELSPEDAAILEQAVSDAATWSVHGLTDALKKKGLSVGYQVVYRHRNRLCSCARMEK